MSRARARGYVRESTKRQADRYGPDAQRTTIVRACAELGLVVDAAAGWYTDLVSGTGRVVRNDFQRALADARAGAFDVLVLYDQSRFARNTRDALNFEAAFAAAGVRVYYAVERYWADDEDLALPKELTHVINAQYSRALRRKIRDGFAAKWEQLGLPGGEIPWGYRWAPDERGITAKRIEVVPEEAAGRRLIFELYGSGLHSARTVTDELNRRGVRIKGKSFTEWTVYEVLRNPIVVGVTRRNVGKPTEERREGVVEPIISRELWERCQRLMRERTTVARGRHPSTFVFSRRAVHAECGHRIWGCMKQLRGRRVVRRLAHARVPCDVAFERDEARLEDLFAAWLATWRTDASHAARVARFMRAESPVEDGETKARGLRARLERARRLYLLGDMDERAFLQERVRMQRDLDAIAAAATSDARPAAWIYSLGQLAKAFGKASLEARRQLVEELTTAVRFSAGSMELVIRPEYRHVVAAVAAGDVHLHLAEVARAKSGRFLSGQAAVTVIREAGPVGCAGLEPASPSVRSCGEPNTDVGGRGSQYSVRFRRALVHRRRTALGSIRSRSP